MDPASGWPASPGVLMSPASQSGVAGTHRMSRFYESAASANPGPRAWVASAPSTEHLSDLEPHSCATHSLMAKAKNTGSFRHHRFQTSGFSLH